MDFLEKKRNKRSQIAIFVIVAIAIVAIIALLFVIRPKVVFPPSEIDPLGYFESCMGKEVNKGWEILGKQGGYINPQNNSYAYKNEKIAYLCYTMEFYRGCVMQEPFIRERVRIELENYLKPKVTECATSLKTELEKRGKDVTIGRGDLNVEIAPARIVLNIKIPITISSAGQRISYNEITVSVLSPADKLLDITEKILNWEAIFGDFDQVGFMIVYPDLKIEKFKSQEGKIYTITDRPSGNKFIFATRSFIFPAGYWENQPIL